MFFFVFFLKYVMPEDILINVTNAKGTDFTLLWNYDHFFYIIGRYNIIRLKIVDCIVLL